MCNLSFPTGSWFKRIPCMKCWGRWRLSNCTKNSILLEPHRIRLVLPRPAHHNRSFRAIPSRIYTLKMSSCRISLTCHLAAIGQLKVTSSLMACHLLLTFFLETAIANFIRENQRVTLGQLQEQFTEAGSISTILDNVCYVPHQHEGTDLFYSWWETDSYIRKVTLILLCRCECVNTYFMKRFIFFNCIWNGKVAELISRLLRKMTLDARLSTWPNLNHLKLHGRGL